MKSGLRLGLIIGALAVSLQSQAQTGNLTTFNGIPTYTVTNANVNPFLDPGPTDSGNPLVSTVLFLNQEASSYRPSLFEDVGSSALQASDAWWHSGDVEKRFTQALINYSVRNGYYATSRDSPRSPRPSVYSPEQEAAFRSEMALSMKRYMLSKGIPMFLKSREETRALGEKYEKAESAVKNAASVNVVTKDNWRFNAGANLWNWKSYVSYANAKWNFEVDTNLRGLHPVAFVQRSFKNGYSSEIRFRTSDKMLLSKVEHKYNERFKTYVSNSLPLANTSLTLLNMFTNCGFDYSF